MKADGHIALIHATAVAIEPIRSAFASLWPDARIKNLLEDSLSVDLAQAGGLTEAIAGRFVELARNAETSGASAVLFTCSAFGAAIDAARSAVSIPVLKPNEAMLEEALNNGTRIGLISTFAPSIESMRAELNALASAHGKRIVIEARTVSSALDALKSDRADDHDALIAEVAGELANCDVLMLAQFSMARAASQAAAASGRPVLTSPASAVRRLKQLLVQTTRSGFPENSIAQ